MTRARDIANLLGTNTNGIIDNAKITLDAAEVPDLAASKITSGTFADARIAASNVSQHASSFDDNKIVNDISTLAIRQASNENKGAYNTNSMYVDVFQDATGIGSLTTSSRSSDEYVSSTVDTTASSGSYAEITYTLVDNVTSNVTIWSGGGHQSSGQDLTNFYTYPAGGGANHYGYHTDYSIYPSNPLGVGNYLQIKYTSGNGQRLHGIQTWTSGLGNTSNTVRWTGSNDGTNFVNLTANTQTLIGGSGEVKIAHQFDQNIATYLYYRLTIISGGTQGGVDKFLSGYKGDVATGALTVNASGNFISNAITAPSSTSKMGAIITYQDQAGTNTLNTDIVLQLSADNGSNFATATMTAMPDFASGIKMAKVNDLSVTAGTQLKYKISFANQSGSKEARIRGVSLQY